MHTYCLLYLVHGVYNIVTFVNYMYHNLNQSIKLIDFHIPCNASVDDRSMAEELWEHWLARLDFAIVEVALLLLGSVHTGTHTVSEVLCKTAESESWFARLDFNVVEVALLLLGRIHAGTHTMSEVLPEASASKSWLAGLNLTIVEVTLLLLRVHTSAHTVSEMLPEASASKSWFTGLDFAIVEVTLLLLRSIHTGTHTMSEVLPETSASESWLARLDDVAIVEIALLWGTMRSASTKAHTSTESWLAGLECVVLTSNDVLPLDGEGKTRDHRLACLHDFGLSEITLLWGTVSTSTKAHTSAESWLTTDDDIGKSGFGLDLEWCVSKSVYRDPGLTSF